LVITLFEGATVLCQTHRLPGSQHACPAVHACLVDNQPVSVAVLLQARRRAEAGRARSEHQD
jgi:hypothetical protein